MGLRDASASKNNFHLGCRLHTPAVDESKETDAPGSKHSHAGDDYVWSLKNKINDNLSSGGSHSGKSSLTEYLAKVRETMVAVHGRTMMHSAHNLVTIVMMVMVVMMPMVVIVEIGGHLWKTR